AMENNVSLSGGDDRNTFRISYSRVKDEGIIPLSDFTRNTLSLAGSSNMTKRLSASGSFTYSNSGGNRVQQGSNLSGLMLNLFRTPISFDNSNGQNDPENPIAYMLADGTQRNYRGGVGYDNPYWSINMNPFKDEVNRLIGSVQANFNATDWLDITYRVGTDFYNDRRKQVFAINSRANPDGQIFHQDFFYRHLNSDLMLNAHGKLSDDLTGSFLLGNNFFRYVRESNYTQGDILNFPGFYNISNASTIITRQSDAKYRTRAFYGQGRLAWKDQLFLEVTGRSESSSTLPEDGNTFFYPSASLGWVFSETYDLSNKWFSYGKLRASYAIVGKDAPLYALDNYYGSAVFGDGWTSGINFPLNGLSGYTIDDVLGNPGLKPERTTSYEFGADLKFLDNRLGIDVTYYNSKSEDQILAVPIAGSSGYQAQVKNAGSMSNKGWEIMLYATPIRKGDLSGAMKDFQWDINLNWSRNRNEVLQLADGVNELFLGGFEGSAIYAVTGQPYGQIYGGKFVRDGNGNLVIVDGLPIQDAQVGVIGNPNPDWLMGITNGFTYKNFSLNALIDIRQGGDIWNGTRGAITFFGTAKETENRGSTKVFEGVVGYYDANNELVITSDPNTTEATLNQSYYQGIGSGFTGPAEPFVEDGSFVRLRELTLSYSLGKDLLKKTPFGSVDIAFIGRNLWLKTDYQGIDPETSLTGANNSLGMDYFNNPGTKSYGVSLRVTL
ncbi:MAG: TonB-dependent receptor domain-containing protein, partial [Bacteroidota bacterium]